MIKKWNEFLIKETIKYEDFEKYPSRLELNFGLSNLELFDCLYDFKPTDFNIKVGYTFMDDVTNRDAIKIDEYLYPTISIQISNRFMKKLDKDYLNILKKVIRKIKAICKIKSGHNFNETIILDPEKLNEEEIDFNSYFDTEYFKLDIDLDSIEQSESKFVYSDTGIESSLIYIILKSDKQIDIDPLTFCKYFGLNGADKISKKGNIYLGLPFKDIAETVFSDRDFVEKYYEPKDYDIIYSDISYIIDDIVYHIDDENKEKLIEFLKSKDPSNEELEDYIEDSSKENLKKLFDSGDFDIINEIISTYESRVSDMYYDSASNFIESSTLELLKEKEIEGDIEVNSEGYTIFWTCFEPSIYVNYYSSKTSPEDWGGDWGGDLHGECIHDMISNHISEFSSEIRRGRDWIDDNYLDGYEINDYIKDILENYND